MKKLKSQDIKRLREEIAYLKQQNYNIEQEKLKLLEKSDEYDSMEKHYLNQLEKSENQFRMAEVKIESLNKKLGTVEYLEKELSNAKHELNDIINEAKHNIEQHTDHIHKLEDVISDKNKEIENLNKHINDNAHLVENDQVQARQMYNDIQDYKTRISDLEDELGQYKRLSHAGPMQDQTNFNFEIQKMEQIYQNKFNSLHQQIDDWKNKFKNEKTKSSQLEEKLKIKQTNPDRADALNNPDSYRDTELTDQIKHIFDIEDDEDILKRLDSIHKEMNTVELIRDELDKAKQLN